MARTLTHGFEDAGLGDAAEIVADGRFLARRHHVQAGGARQPVGLRQADVQPMLADA